MAGGLRVLCTVLCLSQALLLCVASPSLSFRAEPMSVILSQGSTVHLRCSVRPNSASLSLSWRFRGQLLDPVTLPGVELSQNRGSLVLSSLQHIHQGLYQCVAQSDAGAIVSRHARVAIADIGEYGEMHRRSLVVHEGSSVVIECPLPPSNPPALPRLRVRGEWLEKSIDDYIVLPSGNLQILSVSPQHGGMYKCGAYNPVTMETRVEAQGTRLTVKPSDDPSPQRIVYPITPTTLSVEHSSMLVLECVVSGSPSPAAKWLKNGQEVALPAVPAGNSRRHNNLVLLNLKRSDGGNYLCSVTTETGRNLLSVNYTVNVLEEASVLRNLSDQSVSPGDTARFTCVAKGNPTPNVTWLFNSAPIAPSPRLQISGSSLCIKRVTSQDVGVYQCLVDNVIGSAQSAGRLTLQSEEQEPQPGSTADILIDAPPTSVHPIQSDEGDELLPPEEEGEGLGEGLGEGDGLWDTMGQPTERSSDRPTPEAPIITSPPQTHKPDVYDLEWRAGRDWGHPINAYFVKYRKVDDVTWVVGSWHTVRVPGSEKTLRLSELESSSLYEVLMVARSVTGEGQPAMLTFRTGKEKSPAVSKNPSKPPVVSVPKAPEDKTSNTHFGVVIHERVPEAPDRPTISMATESSVYVTWIPRANGGSPITAFRVEYRRQGRSAEWVVAADNISPLKLSVEVRSLEHGSTYKFRVLAMNQNGDSPHSATSRPYQVSAASPRFSDRPVAGPHISSTDAVSDTQIMLRWTYTPSSNNNTPIQGFYIYYRPTDSDNDSDYKRDVVEGLKQWHLIGQLQPETSYDIKMQCFNDGGESEYSNVMICETKARQPPGVPSQHPITPPGPYPPDTPTPPGGLLYLIVGCVLGVMVLILLVFITMCLWRNRQQNTMHKYDPPGYLYQPAEMNGHVLEYPTLPGSSRINGGVHGGYGHSGLPQGCHHLHHKLPNGLALLNGSAGYPSHSHDASLPHSTMEYEHSVPHHHHNGEGVYTALPQTDPSDCMSCQNFCNNNRCYMKTNGTFSSGGGGSLPLMQRMASCQQLDGGLGLEMVPLGQVSPHCLGLLSGERDTESGEHGDQDPEEEEDSSPSQTSCCTLGDHHHQHCPGDDYTADDEPVVCMDSEAVAVCWESLGLCHLDLKEKPVWISTDSLTLALQADLIQPNPQEV
ncbi:cell adhesion molecule-related/down-regulated by oncogenes isoform X1 [Oncorhynchus tshawytscha]|uniref:Cell adhesion molecule-related/down-regulated by oncogenes n=1 Tax=Oncorhynchus tshawytscha TaxID=74940 RepID=A0AAZ3QLE4_ONCTS|nr:cell adhesion molecule-related/down-regulated by oncogenes isoform X1 [Oncorhynchus tshawytscha]